MKSDKERLKTAVSERVSREDICLLFLWFFVNILNFLYLIENMIKRKKRKKKVKVKHP
jgi:hypothetical protein